MYFEFDHFAEQKRDNDRIRRVRDRIALFLAALPLWAGLVWYLWP